MISVRKTRVARGVGSPQKSEPVCFPVKLAINAARLNCTDAILSEANSHNPRKLHGTGVSAEAPPPIDPPPVRSLWANSIIKEILCKSLR